jgi:hypothetical protein
MFKKIKTVMQILTNEEKRKEYDNKRLARLLKRKREEAETADTRRMKDKLFEKENAYKQKKEEEEALKRQTELDLHRLREEGLRKMREQQEKEAQKIAKVQGEQDNLESTIQVKWSAKKRIFNEDQLRDIFSAFGKINLIGFPKNKRTTALISFASIAAAIAAVNEMGDKNVYHFKVKRATKKKSDPISNDDKQSHSNSNAPATAFPFTANSSQGGNNSAKPSVSAKDHLDFEKMILEKMRQASQLQQKLKEEQERKLHENNGTNNNEEGKNSATKPLFAVMSTEEDDSNTTKEVDLNNETLQEMQIRQAKEREELRRKLLEEED